MPQKSCGVTGRRRFLQRARDVAFARVVARDGEQPIAIELLVELLQVVERGARRFEHIAPAVEPPVLREAQSLAGAGNDLPQTRRAAVRIREGIERAFYDRQQRELGRHAARLELAGDMEQIELAPLEDAVEVRLVARVPIAFALHDGVGRDLERKPRAQAHEQVGLDDGLAVLERRQHDRVERNGNGRDDGHRCRRSVLRAGPRTGTPRRGR